jgi:hypothetical protein
VRREVRKMIGVVGKGGGLLIALAHFVEPDVPWENIVALSEAVEESGYYKKVSGHVCVYLLSRPVISFLRVDRCSALC